MMHESPFLSLMADSMDSQASQDLCQIVLLLSALRNMFEFGVNRRKFTADNLDKYEGDLRMCIEKISTSPDIKELISSADGVLEALKKSRKNMNLAADALGMTNNLKTRDQIYELYDQISLDLSNVLKYLQ